jgi:hypothetical protein
VIWIVFIPCGETVGCAWMYVEIIADESTLSDGVSLINANANTCTLATKHDLAISGESDNIK